MTRRGRAHEVPLLRIRLSQVAGWWSVPTDAEGKASFMRSRRLVRPGFRRRRARRHALVAEGEGFEPSVDRKAHNGFRDRPVQPLRHPSEED